jgi:hypothetical protein
MSPTAVVALGRGQRSEVSFASGKSEIFFAPKQAKKREIRRIDQV